MSPKVCSNKVLIIWESSKIPKIFNELSNLIYVYIPCLHHNITIHMFTLIKRLQEKVSKICDSKGQRAYKIAKVMVLVPYKIVSQNQNK